VSAACNREAFSHLDEHQGGACSRLIDCSSRRIDRKEQPMLDVIMLAIGLGFFAIALAYVAGCERL
jgi:hypothetical protein